MAQTRIWQFPTDYHIETCPLSGNPTACDWSNQKGHEHFAQQYGRDLPLTRISVEHQLAFVAWAKAASSAEVS